MLFASGMAATSTALLALLTVGRRGGLQRRDLRRHAAPDRGSLSALRHHGALRRRSRSCGTPERVIGDRTQGVLVRVADQPDAPVRRHRRDRRGVPRARRHLDHRQHVREPDQPAADRARRRPRHAQRDEVPERPQRRDRGRAGRSRRADEGRSTGRASCSAASLDPQAAYAIGRGLKTLVVRMERHNANAMAMARWLEAQNGTRVETRLLSGPRVASRSRARDEADAGFGGMVCVDLGGGYDARARGSSIG